jgi:hypothetical protein
MCTDVRLVRLHGLHVSGRTMDFAQELGSRVQVVPAGNSWSATETGTAVPALAWTNAHGYVAMDALGLDWAACDGLLRAQLRRLDHRRPRPQGPGPLRPKDRTLGAAAAHRLTPARVYSAVKTKPPSSSWRHALTTAES